MEIRDEPRFWLALCCYSRIPYTTQKQIVDLWSELGRRLSAELSAEIRQMWRQALDAPGIEQDIGWLKVPGNILLTFHDDRYPGALKQIADPPLLLFSAGNAELLKQPQLAIVGSRSPTPVGKINASNFSRQACASGLIVTSGLATGIDAMAHRATLEAGGQTIAVMATGPDRIYPGQHQKLAGSIRDSGVLLSEFPCGLRALRHHFPRRNRIISGLSLGVLVVEAARRSGTMITARLAAEQGREVFAIPGSIQNRRAQGCHSLIQQGAKLVEHFDDIMQEFSTFLAPVASASKLPVADRTADDREPILQLLGDDPVSVEDIARHCGQSSADLAVDLLNLELRGLITPLPGGKYLRLPLPR